MTRKKITEALERRFPGLKIEVSEKAIKIGQVTIDYGKAVALAKA